MIKERKADHIRICLEEDVETGHHWDEVRLLHCALPEIDLEEVDTSITFLGRRLSAPLMVASMTGGIEDAVRINDNIAAACQNTGIGMGVGSQRAALEDPSLGPLFEIRRTAPDIFLYANVGAVQLNLGYDREEVARAAAMIGADAVALHLNPLHEACQPDGDTRFGGLLDKIREVCTLEIPVIGKETGTGISREVARTLGDAGISAIFCDGTGGTSFSRVETFRGGVGGFDEWGIPSPISVLECRGNLPIGAGGGIRSGVHMAAAIAMGADICEIALPVLHAATLSAEKVESVLRRFIREFRIAMFLTGCAKVDDLKGTPFILQGTMESWAAQRGLLEG